MAITDLPFIEYHGQPRSMKDLRKKRDVDMYNLSLIHGTKRNIDDYYGEVTTTTTDPWCCDGWFIPLEIPALLINIISPATDVLFVSLV